MIFQSIVFLPWLRLKTAVNAGDYLFIPLDFYRGDIRIPREISNRIEAIKNSYRTINGKVIADFTIVLRREGSANWNFSSEETSEIRRISSLLFLSSLAANRYFLQVSVYSNSSLFEVIEQKFVSTDPKSVAIEFKKRDGSILSGGHDYKNLHIIAPPHYAINKTTSIDEGFFNSLLEAKKRDTHSYNRVVSVINFIELANTDRDLISTDTELILMGSAFETFLEVPFKPQKAMEMGIIFEKFFKSYSSLTGQDIKKCRVDLFIDTKDKMSLNDSVFKIWSHEFYKARNEVVHSKKTDRTWGWNRLEHLLIATYSFPLMVKILLEEEGLYQSNQEDHRQCVALAGIIANDDWSAEDPLGNDLNVWNAIITDASWSLLSKSLMKQLEKDSSCEGNSGDKGVKNLD